MLQICQKCICPTDDTAVKYTTCYTLHLHDDGQQYMVLKDYHLHLRPARLSIELGNMFNGNKVLGELEICILQNSTSSTCGYSTYLSVYFRQSLPQTSPPKFGHNDERSWTKNIQCPRSDNTQDIQPSCNHRAIQGDI